MSPRAKRPPRRATPAYLKNVALHYLEQRSSSRANLRRLLVRRVERSLAEHGGERDEQVGWVDELLEELERLHLLDDAAYAAQRARGFARVGNGSRKIRAKLAAKGLSRELVDAALAELGELAGDGATADLVSACRFARSRRLGPYRREQAGPLEREQRQKELAKLARAGFSYEIAMRVIGFETTEMIDQVLRDAKM